jgi:hypothetical protein
MKIENAVYPFEVSQNGDQRTFTYKKSKLGIKTFIPMLWPALWVAVFLTYRKVSNMEYLTTPEEKMSMSISYGLLYWLVIALLGVIVLNLFRWGKGTFTLTDKGVILGETLYPYADIQSLYIKAPNGSVIQPFQPTSTGFIVIGGDRVQNIGYGAAAVMTAGVGSAVNAAGMLNNFLLRAIDKSIKAKSYRICFSYGKSEKTIVRQVDAKTAEQILHAIQKTA